MNTMALFIAAGRDRTTAVQPLPNGRFWFGFRNKIKLP